MNSKENLIFDCIDAHTQGNPVRLVKGPKPEEVPYPVVMEPNLVIEYYSR